jgi:prepilin-type N-terminal cleavage/methylation domain-containing protein
VRTDTCESEPMSPTPYGLSLNMFSGLMLRKSDSMVAFSTVAVRSPQAGSCLIHSKERRGRAYSNAFTLVELLVVITIISILAALLIPVLSGAKAQAQSAYCKNNLRQQGLAVQMYVDDTRFYPYYSAPTGVLGDYDGVRWEVTLEPYFPAPGTQSNSAVGTQNTPLDCAYQCPTYANIVSWSNYGTSGSWWNNWSYGYNTWGAAYWTADVPNLDYCLGLGVDAPWLWAVISDTLGLQGPGFGNANIPTNLPACRESYVATPSELFAIMDSRGGGPPWQGVDWVEGTTDIQVLAPKPQHGKVFNVLCADGHVTEVPLTTLFNPTNSARNWNVDHQPHPDSWR